MLGLGTKKAKQVVAATGVLQVARTRTGQHLCCKNPLVKWIKRGVHKLYSVRERASGSVYEHHLASTSDVRNAREGGERVRRRLGAVVHAYVCLNCGHVDR